MTEKETIVALRGELSTAGETITALMTQNGALMAQLAGLAEVPCIERPMDDGQMRELALVENVMR